MFNYQNYVIIIGWYYSLLINLCIYNIKCIKCIK